MEFSNKYIFCFSLLLCLVCSLAVASVHDELKDRQVKNAQQDQQSQVLQAAGILSPDEKLTSEEIEEYFTKIKALLVSRETGESEVVKITSEEFKQDPRSVAKTADGGVDAPEKEAKATGVRRIANKLRVFEVNVPGHECLVLEISGNGLWSTLLGYIALSPDTREVRGITYYSHKETPGLGGEVDNPKWKAQWKDKRALGEDGEVLVEVVKGAATDAEREIDGLAGATITSRGVDSMLKLWLGEHGYGPFLKTKRGAL